jgi:four helix bundle protein
MKLEDLRIYQIAVKLRNEVYEEVHRIPFYWKNDDVRQIKKSSSSVPSNIAEGFGRRFYKKEFTLFLSYAIGSCEETPNHAFSLYKSGHISLEKAEYFQRKYKDLYWKIIRFRNRQFKKPQRSASTPVRAIHKTLVFIHAKLYTGLRA